MPGIPGDADDESRRILREVAEVGDFFALDRPNLAGIPLRGIIDSRKVYDAQINVTRHALARLIDIDPHQLPRRPLASLVFLGIAARLVAPTLAAATVNRLVPRLTLDNVNVVELTDGRLVLRVTDFPVLQPGPLPDLVDLIRERLLKGQIAHLVTAFASRDALHPRLLWGNVASTVASAAKLIGEHHPDQTDVVNETTRLVLGRIPLSDCGYLALDSGVRQYHRRSCCLYYQFPRAGTCGDCPLPPGPHPTA